MKNFAAVVAALLLVQISGVTGQEHGRAEQLGAELRQLSLDPESCYRVRDLSIQRGDARIFLTDGWLTFAQPISPAQRRIAAVFVANEAGDDGEILLRPPDRSNRTSLAAATESPNLNEHFSMAVLLFTDRTAEDLLGQIGKSEAKKSADMGLVLAGRHEGLLRNMASSFQVRLAMDLLTGAPQHGFLFAAIAGKQLGNFDFLYDPTVREEITVGRVESSAGRPSFETWASFESRERRQGRSPMPRLGAEVENYRIEAAVQPDLTVEVVTRATLKVREPVAGALGFELAPQMILGEAKLDGKPVETFRRESFRDTLMRGIVNDPFLMVLPEPLAAGSTHEMEFRHHGKVILPAGNKVYYVAARTNWYPSHGNNFANYDLTFRVPKELIPVATGALIEEKEEGEWRIARRRTNAPVRVAGFNIGSYEKVSVKRGDLEVAVYGNRAAEPALQNRAVQMVVLPPPWQTRSPVRRPADVVALTPGPPPNPTARLSAIANEIAGAMEWMAGQFGPPPLKTLTVAPIPGYFGQGFPGLVYLSTVSFLNEQDRPAALRTTQQTTFYSEILHAHEAAHQWWGNLVTPATYHEEWLQEALANYSALLVLEKKKGARALDTVLEEYRGALRAELSEGRTIESAGPVTWGVRLRSDKAPDPWRPIIYDKGSWILHMLRRRMGDAQFLAMLGELRKRYEFKAVTTEEFREHCAKFVTAGQPDPALESFFDTWVYGTGIPELELKTSVRGKAPALKLTVEVRQSGVPEEFSVDLPVEIRFAGTAAPIVRWVRTGSEPAVFSMALKRAPAKVELAPGNGVLAVRR